MDYEKCQMLFYNLYTLLTYKETPPVVYIREWHHTKKCDRFFNFKPMRAAFEKEVTEENLDDIHLYMERWRDQHEQKLWTALNSRYRCRYIFIDWPHEALSSIGWLTKPWAGFRSALAKGE